MSQRLRAARMRRSMTQEVMAERVGVSVPTIAKLENGDPSTSMATVLRVLTVLGLAGDIDLLAAQDTLGRELQDNALRRTNAPLRMRTAPTPQPPPAPASLSTSSVPPVRPRTRKPKP
ncbi:helix-turn-helix transcriptional regulator [Rhodanobacter sp. PCA2]|uniref:helix-turn-helix transcriptional regulator n=1 Tax=Rhodanobacter sp. PCA2 TaxID=2006117 RepID=UPI0021077A86|nr:helix-turn-helix transcriptional regulator [Rhodanobacter sp. PCA2]